MHTYTPILKVLWKAFVLDWIILMLHAKEVKKKIKYAIKCSYVLYWNTLLDKKNKKKILMLHIKNMLFSYSFYTYYRKIPMKEPK